MVIVFDWAGQLVFKNKGYLHRALYFFGGLFLLSWVILMCSLCGLIAEWMLQCIAGLIVAGGAAIVITKRHAINSMLQSAKATWRQGSLVQRLLAISAGAVVLMYAIVCLGPPTDADSLDYHLGAPLEILRTHSIWLNKDFLHCRMLGFGELFNMLCIATGCIQLGAFVQLIALCWMAAALMQAANGRRIATLMLVFGVPLLLTMLPSQKHQLTGVACMSVCFYFVFNYRKVIGGKDYLLVVICLMFAAGLKYNFILSAALMLLYMRLRGVRLLSSGRWAALLLIFCMGLAPLLIYRAICFGDPVSPLLEALKSRPDPVVLHFNRFIKDYTDTSLAFPLSLIIPHTVSSISTVLGCCAGVMVAVLLFCRRYTAELLILSVFMLLIVAFGQRTARFFLEPYYWGLPILIAESGRRRWLRAVGGAVVLQFFLLIPFVSFLCIVMMPGIASNSGRARLMSAAASFYDESRWMEGLVPRDAVVCTDIRSRALLHHKLFPIEYLYFTDFKDSAQVARFEDLLYRKYKVRYLVLIHQGSSGVAIRDYADSLIAGPITFYTGTRNPYNRQAYKAFIYSVRSSPR